MPIPLLELLVRGWLAETGLALSESTAMRTVASGPLRIRRRVMMPRMLSLYHYMQNTNLNAGGLRENRSEERRVGKECRYKRWASDGREDDRIATSETGAGSHLMR